MSSISFKNVQFAQEQTSSTMVISGKTNTAEINRKFSDSVFYKLDDRVEDTTPKYVESYNVWDSESSYKKLERTDTTTDWEKVDWQTVSEPLPTAETELGAEINQQLGQWGIKFEDFKPTDNLYVSKKELQDVGQATITMKFENGALISYSIETDDKTTLVSSSTYTYEFETPVPPKPVE